MARNIRWFVEFKSRSGVNCRVNIYDNDWPAGVTMGLRGAADPFYYEEDDSDDLLNDVMRFRTGYIRVIEQTYGALDDIYPTSTFDRYIEFLYGGNVEFNGYIQVQDFGNILEPGPRVIELPVISPMGLFEQRKFNPITPPTSKTLGQLLDMMLVGSSYQKVTVPDITGIGLWQQVFSLVVSPWNDNYHHSENVGALQKVMEPETYAYLIEGICKAFGWICHDTPQALVFTSFDHTGQYAYYPVGHIGDINYKQTESVAVGEYPLTDWYTPADKDAKMSILLPDTGIEIKYDGDLGNMDFGGFDRTQYANIVSMPGFDLDDGERYNLCNLEPVGILNEITAHGSAEYRTAPDNTDYLTHGSFMVAWNGHLGVLLSLSGSTSDGQEMFKIRLYDRKRTGRSWIVSYEGMSSRYSIAALNPDDNIVNGYIRTASTINDDYVEVVFTFHYGGTTWPQLPDGSLIFIHNIKFEVLEDSLPYAEIRYKPATDSDTLPSSAEHPAISSSVTMPISLYRLNDHMIGTAVRSTKVTEYPYLFQRRLEIDGKFLRAAATEPSILHTRLYGYMGKSWRLISQAFHPWDDEYTLMLQNGVMTNVARYTIMATASNTTLYGFSSVVDEGMSFYHILSANAGYKLDSVAITMGDTDITGTAYDSTTGQISIASVTGNVSIVVEASALPYDAEVNYLQSDGTAYIDLQKTLNSDTDVIDIDFRPVTDSSSTYGVFGAKTGNATKNFSVVVTSAELVFIDLNNGSYSTYRIRTPDSALNLRIVAHVEKSNKYIKADGVQVASSTASSQSFTTEYNAGLFITNGASGQAPFILYSFQWRRNGDLLFDLIPVRKNGVGYLYDKVSGELFGNAAGSGSFSYGDDKTT